jgi:hypothetical protein
MGNPKIAIVAYCRAVGFVLAVHRLSGLSLLLERSKIVAD